MPKNSKKIIATTLSLLVVLAPFYLYAGGLVPECNVGPLNPTTGMYDKPCDFNSLVTLINNVIDFLLFVIAAPFVAMLIAYTGILMITSEGSQENVTKAKNIASNIVIGYILALAAWLIVVTILKSVGFQIDSSLDFLGFLKI